MTDTAQEKGGQQVGPMNQLSRRELTARLARLEAAARAICSVTGLDSTHRYLVDGDLILALRAELEALEVAAMTDTAQQDGFYDGGKRARELREARDEGCRLGRRQGYLRGLRDVREALWQNDLFDCECDCDHRKDEHDDTCDLCDACTLDGIITALIEKVKAGGGE